MVDISPAGSLDASSAHLSVPPLVPAAWNARHAPLRKNLLIATLTAEQALLDATSKERMLHQREHEQGAEATQPDGRAFTDNAFVATSRYATSKKRRAEQHEAVVQVSTH